MSGMKLLPGLSLDQIGHAPSGPQGCAVAQRLRTRFQALSQFLQLGRLQAGFAAGPDRLAQRLGPLLSPGLVPTADRLPVNAQSPGYLPLTEASVKKPGGFEPPSFQFIKITFNAFGIAHARRLTPKTKYVTIFCEFQ